METDDRGRAPRRRLGTRRDDHSRRWQREHVSTLQGEIGVRAGTGDTTVRTSVIANADIGPLTITGLTSSLASPQSAGTSITFIAGATGGPRAVSVQVVDLRRRQLDDRA
jgi:hypothetical protein